MVRQYSLLVVTILIFSLFYRLNRINAQSDLILESQEIEVFYTFDKNFSVRPQGGVEPYTFEVIQPVHGEVNHISSSFEYVSIAGFVGQESFEVTVIDSNGDRASAQFTATVIPPDFVQDQTISLVYDESTTVYVAPDRGVFSLTSNVSGPSNGSLVETDFNSYFYYDYTPNDGFYGTDTFTVTLTDDAGISDSGTITINIPEPNFIQDQTISKFYDQPLDFATLGTIEPDNPTIEITQASNGVVTGDLAGFTYTPNSGFFGTDAFSITITDEYEVVDTALFDVIINAPIELTSTSTTALRQAIEQANANAGKDTIIMLPGTDYDFFIGSYELPEEDGFHALPSITDSLQIIGNGSTLDRQSSDQFRFLAVDAPQIDLILEDLSFTNGDPIHSGGAIFYSSVDGQLIITNTIFDNNRGFHGGAIHMLFGSLYIENSRFVNNSTARWGGAIIVNNATGNPTGTQATIVSSYFENNSTEGSIRARGGAITAYSEATIQNNVFVRNSAENTAAGGALYLSGNVGARPVLVTNNCFLDNDLPQIYTDIKDSSIPISDFDDNWWGSSQGVLSGYMQGTFTSAEALTEGILGCPTPQDITLDVEHDVPTALTLSSDGIPPVTYTVETLPEVASISGSSPNLTILNEANYYGTDELSYSIVTADNLTGTGFVTLNLLPDINSPLEASLVVVDATHQELTSFRFDITGGMYPYTAELLTIPENGITYFQSAGYNFSRYNYDIRWRYLPDSNFTGSDTFTFLIQDNIGNTTEATVIINVREEDPATIFVDSNAYEQPLIDNGNCTVAEALEAARLNSPVDQCNAGQVFMSDIIYVPAGVYYGPLSITDDVVIRGAGKTETIFERISEDESTIFDISGYINVQFEHLSIRNGGANRLGTSSYQQGGGIYSQSVQTLRLFDVLLFNNYVNSNGGAIYIDNSIPWFGFIESYNSFYINNSSSLPGFVLEGLNVNGRFLNNAFSDNGNYGDGALLNGFFQVYFNCFTNPTHEPVASRYDFEYNWEYGSPEAPPAICAELTPLRELFFADVIPAIVESSPMGGTSGSEGTTLLINFEITNLPAEFVDVSSDIGDINHLAGNMYEWQLYLEDGLMMPTTFPVILTATNNLNPNLTTQLGFDYTVTNTPPVAEVTIEPTIIAVGETVTIDIRNVSDPSLVDMQAGFTYSYACDVFVGYDVTNISHLSYTCQYNTGGTYRPVGQIIDKDGGTQTYFVDIEVIERGDCNADTVVDAQDLSALQLEIFDDDSSSSIASANFDGNPIGCDANDDTTVDAGDLACVQAMILDEDFVCDVAP